MLYCTHTHRYRCTHRNKHTDTRRHRHTDIHTQTHTHTHRDTHTHTHTNSDIPYFVNLCLCIIVIEDSGNKHSQWSPYHHTPYTPSHAVFLYKTGGHFEYYWFLCLYFMLFFFNMLSLENTNCFPSFTIVTHTLIATFQLHNSLDWLHSF
jgi:hypothetical protein